MLQLQNKHINNSIISRILLTASALILGVLLLSTASCGVEKDEQSPEIQTQTQWQYEIVSGSSLRLTGCPSSQKEYVIPAELDNMPVTVIGSSAFAGQNPETVRLPDSVTVIEDEAFINCQSLREINLSSVAKIGKRAFSGCRFLGKAEFGEALNELGGSAFEGCETIDEITIPAAVSELPEHAFSNCYSLKKAVFPDELIKIGAYSFSDCISLENPDMPASLVSIGEFAFMGCHSIKTADLGGADYGKGVWMDCRRLTDISFSGKKIKISDYLFAGCVSLSTLNIPSNVTSIGEASFRYCTGLNRIEINNSVTDIKRDAFSDCGAPVIAAPQTSAAHRYALAFGFKYEDTSKS